MIDLLHLPEPDERTVWFPGQGESTNTTGWRVWTKPRGVSMVSILAIGSGGGAGGGAGNISGSTAGGGAGGGCAPMAKMLFPAWALPDNLYVLSVSGGLGGNGGVSGSPGTAGIAGAASIVSIYPNTTAGNLLVTTLNGGARGNAGTTSAGGAGTGPLSTPTATSAPLGQMSTARLFVTGTGTFSGSTGANSDISVDGYAEISTTAFGGGGGGKTTGAGGKGAGYGLVNNVVMIAVPGGTASTGDDASSGFIHAGFIFGGCGGGGNNLGVGGRGGNGVVWGAGAGGGGGGLTGGRGGDGGPGLVIIASW